MTIIPGSGIMQGNLNEQEAARPLGFITPKILTLVVREFYHDTQISTSYQNLFVYQTFALHDELTLLNQLL